MPALAAKKPAAERPNLVLILVDNLPTWMLACYGNKEVRSPNIQRLSDTGTRFLNHYAAASMPGLDRATLLTGRTPMQIGDAGTPGPADVTIDKLLSDAGYSTHATGAAAAADAASEAQKFLDQQAPAKPFALTVSFGDLKPPYDSTPQKYLEMYAQEKFDGYAADPVAPNARAGKEMLLDRVAGLRKVAATITAIDDQIGSLLAKLSQKQLLDNTLVLFTSTCGALYGRHGLWDAGQASDPVNMYDEVVKTPHHLDLAASHAAPGPGDRNDQRLRPGPQPLRTGLARPARPESVRSELPACGTAEKAAQEAALAQNRLRPHPEYRYGPRGKLQGGVARWRERLKRVVRLDAGCGREGESLRHSRVPRRENSFDRRNHALETGLFVVRVPGS